MDEHVFLGVLLSLRRCFSQVQEPIDPTSPRTFSAETKASSSSGLKEAAQGHLHLLVSHKNTELNRLLAVRSRI